MIWGCKHGSQRAKSVVVVAKMEAREPTLVIRVAKNEAVLASVAILAQYGLSRVVRRFAAAAQTCLGAAADARTAAAAPSSSCRPWQRLTRGSSEKMVSFKILACLALAVHGSPCADPYAAIRKTIECVQAEDSACVNDGYDMSRFSKYHNGKKVGMQWPAATYWQTELKFSNFNLLVNHAQNVGTNKAEFRYLENIRMTTGAEFEIPPRRTWPFNALIKQYEHAIVIVDNNSNIIRWDQYGDNVEQTQVQDAVGKMMEDERIKRAVQ